MFFDLPYDCIILIIDYLYEKKESKSVLINSDPKNNIIKKINYIADWKKTKKKYNIIREKYRWEPPSFVSIISLIYTSINMKNIFDNNENIPESIRKDPAKLIEFGSSSREERDKAKDKLDKGDGGTIVGAKKEDYERLGVKKPSGSVSLHEEAKKKGGTLNMEDLMKLHGVT